MTIRNLDFLFRPHSVAVIVDSESAGNYAEIVQRNLLAGGFAGPVMWVTARKRSRFKVGPRVRLSAMEAVPELAVICSRLEFVAEIITQLGEAGTRAVIIAPSLRERLTQSDGALMRKAILDAARPYLIRVLGPGSGGLLIPSIGLNASVSPIAVLPGKIALITQSTAVASGIVDHATSKGFGFSAVLHLGEGSDIDLADALDWFAEDAETERILVQFDSISAGRKFMSAARASARNKPVAVIRSHQFGKRREAKLPFCLDDVYDAALNRAGWVQVATLGEAFEASQAMARLKPMSGAGLVILANGYGLGKIAADVLLNSGGKLARLENQTLQKLTELLQTRLPLANPLELPPAISAADWARVLAVILADQNSTALMTVYSPSPFACSTEVAGEIGRAAQTARQNIFSCWVGGDSLLEAQHIADEHGVLSHDSPEQAVAVFMGLVNYYRNRELLMQMPPSLPEGYSTDLRAARAAIDEGLQSGSRLLSAALAHKLLLSFGLESVEYCMAASAEAALEVANSIGYPVDIGLVLVNAASFNTLKSNLRSPADIHMAIRSLRKAARDELAGVRVSGYRLRRSAPRSGMPPLSIGVAADPLFGPIIYLGPSSFAGSREGGFVVELPPLNLTLAQNMVNRSRLGDELPAELRPALEANICTALVRLSQMLSDMDEVVGVELNPLHVEISGVIALQAKIFIETSPRKLGPQRFAISPYPKELERQIDWRGEQLLIRPIRPEDESMLGELLDSLTPEDSRLRFFATLRGQSHLQLARFSQIDYDREMSLVIIQQGEDGELHALGEARLSADADNQAADYAIVVASSFSGKGLGRLLMQQLIDYARNRGIGVLRGETLAENRRMQHLAQTFGFVVEHGGDPGTINLRLTLHE